ncbi:MAG TPA: DUF58 domain-containing protein [Gammaproteobacteria bacterium]|nr:DUF58 domain-containing protein [Gammaproteobacteria bacterium]
MRTEARGVSGGERAATGAAGRLRGPRAALDRWIRRRMGRQGRTVRLDYPRIYILPSRAGVGFGALVAVMGLGSVNYGNSLGFLLTFLLVGVAFAAMLHTFRNLAGLEVAGAGCDPVFAGGVARFRARLGDRSGRDRWALAPARAGGAGPPADVPGGGSGLLTLEVPAPSRGWLRPGRFALATAFPTGLFRAWSWLDPDWACLVYPRPESGAVPGPEAFIASERGGRFGEGDEDFRGLRRYQAGDPPRHLAWRLLARGQELHTKQFAGRAPSRVWLDWAALAGMDAEARIARLTRWVLDAERAGRIYGLRLPDTEIPPDQGPGHRHRCLEALALLPA